LGFLALRRGDAKIAIKELLEKAGGPRNLNRSPECVVEDQSEFVPFFVFWRLAYIFFCIYFSRDDYPALTIDMVLEFLFFGLR
jgi:hypothetical protein